MSAGVHLGALYLAKDTGLTKHLSPLLGDSLLPPGMSQRLSKLWHRCIFCPSNSFYIVELLEHVEKLKKKI